MTADLRMKMVTCMDCGKHYRCTPNSDYFAIDGKPRSPVSGRCWDCHLEAHGMPPQPEPQMGDELYPMRLDP